MIKKKILININKCLDNPKEREELSSNAKSLYQSKFTADLVYGEFIKFVEHNYGDNKKEAFLIVY